MRLTVAALTLAAALLGALRAQASPDRQARSPNACALLRAAVRSESPAGYVGLRFTATGGFNCSASRGSPGSVGYRVFTFGFLPPAAWGSSAAAHAFWQARWKHWRGKSGKEFTVERLRGFGADDAFGVEQRSQDPAPRTDTNITWVKGAYEGGVEVSGPGLSGDLDDGQTLLKTLMKGIPPA